MTDLELDDLAFELAHETTALHAGQVVRELELPEHFLLEVFSQHFIRVNRSESSDVSKRARLAKILEDLRIGYSQSRR